MKELLEKAEKIGALAERSRIMEALVKADLPLGVWPLIREIINPKS